MSLLEVTEPPRVFWINSRRRSWQLAATERALYIQSSSLNKATRKCVYLCTRQLSKGFIFVIKLLWG